MASNFAQYFSSCPSVSQELNLSRKGEVSGSVLQIAARMVATSAAVTLTGPLLPARRCTSEKQRFHSTRK